ncbi:Ubiquitinyl hydrolase 1 protein [Dioscorea alata]|nr:Ubiquitinyl hydrolase 1 protein [Dioscorea alata]
MLAMGNYVSSFNLTRQQDAAEAFLHLLSSLEEEVLQYYVPLDSSLADIVSLPSRIHQPIREGLSDCAQWQKHYIGPLAGTISSILVCRSCSSVLSMDIESFHCLPLTPLQAKISDVVDGCTLVDCIKHFIAPEHVENYRCSRCWHDSALKYLSSKSQKDEEKMETISNCVKIDSCDCKNLFLPEEVMWNGFSDAVKRLRIARCPKILCIHLQRASMSSDGDLIKLQGYISFPQVLDMFPFTEVAIEMEQQTFFENTSKRGVGPQHLLPTHMQWKMQMLSQIYKISGETIGREASLKNKMENSFRDSCADYPFSKSDVVPDSIKTLISGGSSSSSRKIQYRLSSVVEHYGRPESGHYAVYRRVSFDSVGSETPGQQWLYISDDKVSRVSEEAVFTAEASLLFYERLEEHL